MKTGMFFPLIVALILPPAYAGHETRSYPENALPAAVNYVGNLGGGMVQIGPGEYVMRDWLHMRSRRG
ncbi:MAG TPA: hypothetical protein VMZ06_14580 [Candidatus Bathyarchaeia archaeon]|nr:hypothetical protein [Candidatus Bathyarchaeia archaeon]